ncbi:MAG: circadian clock protein KaiC [Candidatus Bathyarchaeota archaeon BA2]|nr:MAG: circadian clock protein KaiC [Candidatus Bathyarchaeota archaeon BA2]
MSERVPTGIDGLDALIKGGFLRGDVILVAGGTGSGKTIFSTQFIYKGATQYGENGVYATFEEDAKTLKRNMFNFGFDLGRLEQKGAIKVIDLEVLKGEGLSANIQFILGALDEIDGKRLVIDSLTAFLTACPERFEYRMLMRLIYRMLKTRGITTIITCSVPVGAETLGLGIEEFLADSVVCLENVVDSLELRTRFLICKMRGTDHSRKYHNVTITDKGLQIVPFTIT